MKPVASLMRAIKVHPWSSLQDASLLAVTMLVGLLLALEYDFAIFGDQLDPGQRRLRVEEMVALTLALGIGILIFILRRLQEERRDVERRLRAEYDLRANVALAMEDALTALPNRRAICGALEAAAPSAGSGGPPFAFYLLDLNGFKRINDKHGHATGDEVLCAAARRLRAATREGDLLARLGGDEFAVLAYGVASRESAREIGDRFTAALRNRIHIGEEAFAIGAAIGVALCPQDGTGVDEIVRNADLAMYAAKAEKSSSLRFFERAEPASRIALRA